MFSLESKDEKRLRSMKPPKILFFSQLLLFLILFRYAINFLFITYPEDVGMFKLILNFLNIGYMSIMGILAVEALLGLTSAKPQSWRKVVRSALIMTLSAIFVEVLKYFELYMSSLNFGLLISVAMTVMVLLIMFLPHVRRFYIPSEMEVPPVKDWIMFIFDRPIVTAETYRFTYDGDQRAEAESEQ